MRYLYFAFVLMSGYSPIAYSCAVKHGSAYPSHRVDGGFIRFDEVLLGENENTTHLSDEIGINVSFHDCLSGSKKLIGELPYLASTGKIEASFFADANRNGVDELFVIHRVNIRSDTGVSYFGDYYTVLIYAKTTEGYSVDASYSNYFGRGGDIMMDADETNRAYIFPYKSERLIREKLASQNYIKWVQGRIIKFQTKNKTLLREAPVLADEIGNLLPGGISVVQKDVEGGWISVISEISGISGWVKCEEIEAC